MLITDRWSQSLRRWLPDCLGVLVVIGAALAVMVPALARGSSIGPFDLLASSGLTKAPGVLMHNPTLADQIQEMIPWSQLAWTQVHQGHLPLWNPYSVLGMPLAFNWQSATFSLPALVGYLFPLRLSYTVQVVLTPVIAGTGVYVFGRVMRVGILGSAFAATAFELSGPFMAWLGWPIEGVMSWMGWIAAAIVLVMQGRHRVTGVVMLALSLALAVYAGEADALTVLVLALLLFVSVLFLLKIPALGGSGPVLRPLGDLVAASAAGAMLAAPLALPGIDLVSSSVRGARRNAQGVPGTLIEHLLVEGYNGSPLAGHVFFGTQTFYQDSLAYVGVIALALAVVAVATRRRRPEVVALAVVAVASTAVAFAPPVLSLVSLFPRLSAVGWQLALVPLAFSVTALGGVGLDVLVHSWRRRDVRLWTAGSFAALLVLLGVIRLVSLGGHLTPQEASERAWSFVWPTALCVLGLLVVGALSLVDRRLRYQPGPSPLSARVVGRWAGALLLAGEVSFLLVTGAPMLSSSPSYLTPTPAVNALKSAVGPSLVGWGLGSCYGVGGGIGHGLGIAPDVNVAFEVHELAVYDPITPNTYDRSWHRLTGGWASYAAAIGFTSWYCPAVTNATWARLYGVSYILEKAGAAGPTGAVFDEKIGDETLYRVPGAALATLTPAQADGQMPDDEAPGTPVTVTHPNPSTWRMSTDASTPQVLRLRLTDVPGWHASIDGRPLTLAPFAGVMLQARIPQGRHTVQVTYWPTSFTEGIILAVVAALGLSGLVGVSAFRRYRRRSHGG